ncbi:hypothetical protein [Marinoscillum sp. 108]|uniref:hypothetical protein n=1 Tax=Marinoscillum sp. 108 TaxID=2653151 RepID=UPI0012F3D550|nr:hypothetical protein [Marinoscillum sp. 108]VXD18541.1 conserved hypothetical protein [Marinoscillum sp. 108]
MRYLTTFLLAALVHGLYSQSPEARDVYETARHTTEPQYSFDGRYEYLVLPSSFSKDDIRKLPFTDRRILKIDLVYTTFRESSEFDQKQLDLARLDKLIEINPQIVVNKFFEWNIIGQTGCASSASCLDFFHGFVIYYEDYFTKETSLAEIDSVRSDLMALDQRIGELRKLLKIDYRRIDCEYPESAYSPEYLGEQLEKIYDCAETYKGRVFFEVELDYNGRPQEVTVSGNLFPCKERLAFALKYILKWKRGLVIGRRQYNVRAKGYVSFPIKKESVNITSFEISKNLMEKYKMLQQYAQCVAYETDTSYVDIFPKVDQKVVSKALFRNHWSPDLVIVDVTGSMYPYTADLLKWIKLSSLQKETDFVFFNDGNDLPTNQKVIGKTGGLYHVKTNDFSVAKEKMFEAMRAGGGGDLPENNFEALVYGEKVAKPGGEVVMIADNYSFPRDSQLLARHTGQLKIILCHTEKGINTQYLDLARKHGFTLHTLQTDIVDLQKEMLRIEGVSYKREPAGFVRIR